jgi:hypothetical protein
MFSDFFRVSHQEQLWALSHPFIAGEAYRLTQRTNEIVDSLKIHVLNDTLDCDGLADATRHTLWMALLSSNIRAKAACKLGCSHELANYQTYQQNLLNGGCIHDSVSAAMDIHNNTVGLKIGIRLKGASEKEVIKAVLNSIHKGECLFILSNAAGFFLDENNQPIPNENLESRWFTARILVPTNYVKEQ